MKISIILRVSIVVICVVMLSLFIFPWVSIEVTRPALGRDATSPFEFSGLEIALGSGDLKNLSESPVYLLVWIMLLPTVVTAIFTILKKRIVPIISAAIALGVVIAFRLIIRSNYMAIQNSIGAIKITINYSGCYNAMYVLSGLMCLLSILYFIFTNNLNNTTPITRSRSNTDSTSTNNAEIWITASTILELISILALIAYPFTNPGIQVTFWSVVFAALLIFVIICIHVSIIFYVPKSTAVTRIFILLLVILTWSFGILFVSIRESSIRNEVLFESIVRANPYMQLNKRYTGSGLLYWIGALPIGIRIALDTELAFTVSAMSHAVFGILAVETSIIASEARKSVIIVLSSFILVVLILFVGVFSGWIAGILS